MTYEIHRPCCTVLENIYHIYLLRTLLIIDIGGVGSLYESELPTVK